MSHWVPQAIDPIINHACIPFDPTDPMGPGRVFSIIRGNRLNGGSTRALEPGGQFSIPGPDRQGH